jgi:hypothetical protein
MPRNLPYSGASPRKFPVEVLGSSDAERTGARQHVAVIDTWLCGNGYLPE